MAILLAIPLLGSVGLDDPKPARALPAPPRNLFDPRLATLRAASAGWLNRPGPTRRVVDVVCLVPDLPTYLAAVGAWDRDRWFPVLFDRTEPALRFLRAFRPSRVVRMPRQVTPTGGPEELWALATETVGKAWTPQGEAPHPGDRPPGDLDAPGPPGVVVSSPASPSLAAAVALAAGRFQPLVRWEPGQSGRDVPGLEDALRLAAGLEQAVARVAPGFGELGDDCDFVTLAGDWPDRYRIEKGEKAGLNALDDLLARDLKTARRWGYVGRIEGGHAQAAYQAMCSLFLQPESAILFNGYDESDPNWKPYAMRQAAATLAGTLPTEHRAGSDDATLPGWHRAFDPINRHGLVLINTKGGPAAFDLLQTKAQTRDVPMSVPAAVLMIHSFSAQRPADTSTLAGRWRANGAFLYYGSMNEPYLVAFRTPMLVASLLADGLPVSAAVRKLTDEDPFGTPWRLVYLGDPLYRLAPEAAKAPRLPEDPRLAGWPAYDEGEPPSAAATDLDRLRWCLRAALVQAARLEGGEARAAWQGQMLAIKRAALPDEARRIYDDLLADLVTFARPGVLWRRAVEAIPEAERSDALRRSLEAREALGVDRPGRAPTRR
jgi:hypothetical protein